MYDTLELAVQLYPMRESTSSAISFASYLVATTVPRTGAMPDAEAAAELFIDLTSGAPSGREDPDDIAAEYPAQQDDYNRAEQGERMEDIRRQHGIGSGLMSPRPRPPLAS